MGRTAVAIALLASACAAPSASRPPERSTVVISSGHATEAVTSYSGSGTSTIDLGAAPDEVWAAMAEAYADMEVPASVIDRDAYIYGNRRFTSRRIGGRRLSTFIRCGSGPFGTPKADEYQVELAVVSILAPSTAGTTLRTQVHGHAVPRGVSGSGVQCTSTGILEQELHDAVARQLVGTP